MMIVGIRTTVKIGRYQPILITRMASAMAEMMEKRMITEYFDMLLLLKDAPEMVLKNHGEGCVGWLQNCGILGQK